MNKILSLDEFIAERYSSKLNSRNSVNEHHGKNWERGLLSAHFSDFLDAFKELNPEAYDALEAAIEETGIEAVTDSTREAKLARKEERKENPEEGEEDDDDDDDEEMKQAEPTEEEPTEEPEEEEEPEEGEEGEEGEEPAEGEAEPAA